MYTQLIKHPAFIIGSALFLIAYIIMAVYGNWNGFNYLSFA